MRGEIVHRLLRVAFIGVVPMLPAWCAGSLEYAIQNDHTNLIYRLGEENVCTVTVKRNGKPVTSGTVEASLDNFARAIGATRRVDLAKENPFTVKGTLLEPGFLRLCLDAKDEPRKIWSVAYEPTKIVKGSPSPDDFDAFWAAAKAKLAREVPLDAKMTKVPERCTSAFTFYRLSFATFGRRVYGYLTVPTDKKAAPYPVEIEVSAAGFGDWTNNLTGDGKSIHAFFAVYPWAPHWDWRELGLSNAYSFMNEAYARQYGCGGYATAGLSKGPEQYFFYPVILGIDRAVDWIAQRPDIDHSRFWYKGTSQGGGFGFYLAALNRHFTRAAMFVPALTDTMGYRKGVPSGWPKVIENQSEEGKKEAEKGAPYFDAANFASRITCPVRVAVGFADMTCPPYAVYAAYNEIKVADKGIVHGFGMTHSCFSCIYDELLGWLRR